MANADLEKYYKALDRYFLFFLLLVLIWLMFLFVCLFFCFRLVRQFIYHNFDIVPK